MSDEPRSAEYELCDRLAQELSEHFDTVQIFTSRHIGGGEGTRSIAIGRGNWFARVGQVQAWLAAEDECNRIEVRDSTEEP